MRSLDLWNRLFRPILSRIFLKASEKSAEKCKKCKGNVTDIASFLYLLPARFSEEHEESAEYYLRNAVRIESTEQIPHGSRACYMYVFQCQNCGHKFISIVDFLQVRENALIKGGDIYPYETFQHFLYND